MGVERPNLKASWRRHHWQACSPRFCPLFISASDSTSLFRGTAFPRGNGDTVSYRSAFCKEWQPVKPSSWHDLFHSPHFRIFSSSCSSEPHVQSRCCLRTKNDKPGYGTPLLRTPPIMALHRILPLRESVLSSQSTFQSQLQLENAVAFPPAD